MEDCHDQGRLNCLLQKFTYVIETFLLLLFNQTECTFQTKKIFVVVEFLKKMLVFVSDFPEEMKPDMHFLGILGFCN